MEGMKFLSRNTYLYMLLDLHPVFGTWSCTTKTCKDCKLQIGFPCFPIHAIQIYKFKLTILAFEQNNANY